MKNISVLKLSAVAAIVIASTATAQEIQTSTSTVTITNAFDLTETTPLSFGTVRASQAFVDGTDDDTDATGTDFTPTITNGGGIRIMSNGTATEVVDASAVTQGADIETGGDDTIGTVSSSLGIIVDGAPGEYAIANAAAFTNLRVTDPVDTGELTNPSAPAASKFDLDIDFADMTIVGGGNDGDTVTGTNLLTDASGSVAFRVGGELTIDPLATSIPDGVYSGTYIIEVAY